ncbi:tetratricopeptide repeat protein [Streptomyces sp. NPDC020298]|uniref:tetratricopeptide repeat protein n=1 Tax=unclassified Streptomyces TaxID=2593676 RepID=UPI0033F8007F
MTVPADRPSVPLRPLVSWPEEVEGGQKYLVTVDVEFDAENDAWPYDTEEYAIGCMVEGGPGLAVESAGDTTLVLHRFGGTYGPARFVTYSVDETGAGQDTALLLTLITAGGVPFRSERLPVRTSPAGQLPPGPRTEVELPGPVDPDGPGAEVEEETEEEAGTVLVLAGSDGLHAALYARLTDRKFSADHTIGTLVGTARRVVVMSVDWQSPQFRREVMAAGQRHGVSLVVSLVHGRGVRRRLEYGDVVVATEVELRSGIVVRPSSRLVESARVVMGSSAYYEPVRPDTRRDQVCLNTAYTTPAAEHLTICAVGRAAVDRATEVLRSVLGTEAPRIDRLALPRVPAAFTGRDAETGHLLKLLNPSERISTERFTLVSGMPGIGKTVFAVAAAREAVERGWFPGGAYWIPPGPEAAAAVARSVSRLRDGQQPVLVVHDEATWAEAHDTWDDVPARSRFHVLVTSRPATGAPDERHMVLRPLTPQAATAVLGAAGPENEAAQRLAALCGGVPLALRLAAQYPGTLAQMLDRTESAGGIFHVFDELRNAFDTEYARLAPAWRTALRLLSAAPGDDLGTESVAVLFAGHDAAVRGLHGAGLIVQEGPAEQGPAERLRVETLPKEYVRQVLGRGPAVREEATSARRRLLAFCLDRTRAAVTDLGLGASPPDDNRPGAREDALAWLDGERDNLVAQALEAPAYADADHVADLVLLLGAYLNWRRDFERCLDCCATALDQHVSAHLRAHLMNLRGAALRGTGRLAEATRTHELALTLHEQLGDAWGAAKAHEALGLVAAERGDWATALTAHTRALDGMTRVGDRRGEAEAGTDLGVALLKTGAYAEGFEYLSRATDICRELDDRPGTARALLIRAEALYDSGGMQDALALAEEAAPLFEELTDDYGRARVLEVRARANEELRRYTDARNQWKAAVEAYRRVGDTESATRAIRHSYRVGIGVHHREAQVLITVASGLLRTSSYRWAVLLARGQGWETRRESRSSIKINALPKAVAEPLGLTLREADTPHCPAPVEIALPLTGFDLAPHTWRGTDSSQPLGSQRPVTLRYTDRGASTLNPGAAAWQNLQHAQSFLAWYLPLPAAGEPLGVHPRGGIPFLCGPVSHGPGREIMSRLLTESHGVALWTTAPHAKECGPQCERLIRTVDDFLRGIGSIAEIPRALWWLRVQGRDEQLSLLYDDPLSPLPNFHRPAY